MEIQSRCFPYNKSIVINALYDTIDALGLSLDNIDSSRGTLVVSDAQHTGNMRIALNAENSTCCTQIDIFPDDPDLSIAEMWGPVILDDLSGTIQRTHCSEKKYDFKIRNKSRF